MFYFENLDLKCNPISKKTKLYYVDNINKIEKYISTITCRSNLGDDN